MKRDPKFENYTYAQQANSLKMVINWIVPAVAAHMRKGRGLGKDGVGEYPRKVIRQLQLVQNQLERLG